MFNKDITIFNKKYDNIKRTDVYKRTVIKGVHAEMTQSSDLKDKAMSASDILYISIPFSISGYILPKEYQKLDDIENKWTLQEGDIVVLGAIDKDINNAKELDKKYMIKSAEVIDYSVTCLNHYEVYAS